MPIEITLEQVQKAFNKAYPTAPYSNAIKVTELTSDSLSYTQAHRTYIIDLSFSKELPTTYSAFLIAASAAPFASTEPNVTETTYHSNTLQIYAKLISLVKKFTSLPFDYPTLDTSLSAIPYPYLLTTPRPITSLSIISLSSARKKKILSPQHNALIDLTLGQMLGQLHSGVLNEWFGLPLTLEPTNPSYSWQETFSLLIESLLHQIQSHAEYKSLDLPYEDIRRYLSRAIAFYLFDDVEAPSLVWFTGSEDDVYVTLPPIGSPDPPTIVAILPNLPHAFWGDPLLESLFLPPGPTEALREGYLAGGGHELVVFSRQKTKRLWYTVFLALVVLKERIGGCVGLEGKWAWAIEALREAVVTLKDAPCY
ncbi:hypothetical protein E1B28_005960 [Marasmius oreades]|uniref:Aminoglycoside phosphotransferase domain-containing protein n=1 Tax=Marasmius oreades TaxID=181124 RepID=A0A9P7S5P5_9AGAR|nr:uncharacterized protein E1B28_005960 [Marasmius oreades]KAG7095181.1 hypothetical protein E1B28_005960 [Marasmius oreades]